ncbi:MAG: (Fe-S)-binding protein [Acidimicrobiia bacterium]|nr:(Fe-S)-binding protein [Acidimicrobiia bacterium]
MGWVTPEAPKPEELSACIQCGLCLPVCPTFRLTGDEVASPRGRLTAMSAVADGIAEVDDTFHEIMSFCLQCRACEPACPSLVPFGRAMEGARAEIAAQLPSAKTSLRQSLLGRRGLGSGGAVRGITRLAALGQLAEADRWLPGRLKKPIAGLRRLGLRSTSVIGQTHRPKGTPVATVGLLAGCVMDSWFPEVHKATIATLVAAGYAVSVPESQSCCGALAAHDGAVDEAKALAGTALQAFRDVDLVVSDAAGCGAHLKELGHWASGGRDFSSKVRDVTELVAESISVGRLPRLAERGVSVAIQDPCHLRHAQRIVAEPRDLLRAGGYTVLEIDPNGMCCGAAGLYSVLRPETSSELGDRKAAQVMATGARIVASANPGCEMQLRSSLGSGFRVAHPVELYAEAVGLV